MNRAYTPRMATAELVAELRAMYANRPLARALAYASELGRTNGANAGEWFAMESFGGRVTRGARESARRIVAGIADGDPEILDLLPSADLSGEMADTLTGPLLVDEARYSAGVQHDGRHDLYAESYRETCPACRLVADGFNEICDAYELAYADAASETVERLARNEMDGPE